MAAIKGTSARPTFFYSTSSQRTRIIMILAGKMRIIAGDMYTACTHLLLDDDFGRRPVPFGWWPMPLSPSVHTPPLIHRFSTSPHPPSYSGKRAGQTTQGRRRSRGDSRAQVGGGISRAVGRVRGHDERAFVGRDAHGAQRQGP